MSSLPNNEMVTISGEEQQQDLEDSGPTERAQWLINSPEPPSLWQELFSSAVRVSAFSHGRKKSSSTMGRRIMSFLQNLFPILSWGRSYKASIFKDDLLAGLTIASLSIPQSIGYASLAKLDPRYGLYTSLVPPLIYALMGSSRDLAIGPVAIISLLISSMVPNLVDPAVDPLGYRNLVFTVTFFAGTFQAIFGIFRLGFLIHLLSHAAIVGFMAGAAIVIGLQQLKGLFGLSHFTNKTDVVSVMGSVIKTVPHEWHPLNFIIGFSFLVFLLVARFIGRRNRKLFWFPAIAPLLSVILSTLIVYLTKADKHGVKIVKHLTGGINPSSLHQLQFKGPHVAETARIGLITAIIALTEAIAVGRTFASIKGYHLDGNKEMMAMGFMNVVGSLTSCYVATGAFARTAVNVSAGCRTVVSNIVMAITVLLSLELFTRLLYYTPIAILASIIMSAVLGLIDINEAYYIWKVDKLDFLACLGTFLGVLFKSVEIGLLVAVCISFAKILLNTIRPAVEQLGRLPRSDVFCEVGQFPMANKTPGILTLRVNCGLLCFANANFLRDRIIRCVKEEETEETAKDKIKILILDMSNVMNVDTSGILALEELHNKMVTLGIKVSLSVFLSYNFSFLNFYMIIAFG